MRKKVFDVIKTKGPIGGRDIAQILGVTKLDVFQEIYWLQKQGKVKKDPNPDYNRWYALQVVSTPA